MSAKRRTRSGSRSAARPSISGHCEKAPAAKLAPAFSAKEWRGSEETVTGMPCGVVSASSCSALFQRAALRASPSWCTLKWFISLPVTTVVVADLLMAPAPSTSAPSGPDSITVWNMQPTFSASDRRPRRSATRSSTPSRGSSYGSRTPLPFRSRKTTPSGVVMRGSTGSPSVGGGEHLGGDHRADMPGHLALREVAAKSTVGQNVTEGAEDHGLIEGKIALRHLS